MEAAVKIPKKLTIDSEVLRGMVNLRDEIDGIIETIEIMNAQKLMAGINRGDKDIREGKTTRFDSADEAKKWIKNEPGL